MIIHPNRLLFTHPEEMTDEFMKRRTLELVRTAMTARRLASLLPQGPPIQGIGASA